jgi:hypothetical protein
MSAINLKLIKQNIGRLDISSTKKLLDEVKNNPQRYPPRIALRIYDIIGRILTRRLDISNIKELFPVPSKGAKKLEYPQYREPEEQPEPQPKEEEEKPKEKPLDDGFPDERIEELGEIITEGDVEEIDGVKSYIKEDIPIKKENQQEIMLKTSQFFTRDSDNDIIKVMRIYQSVLKDLADFNSKEKITSKSSKSLKLFGSKSSAKLPQHMNTNNIIILKNNKTDSQLKNEIYQALYKTRLSRQEANPLNAGLIPNIFLYVAYEGTEIKYKGETYIIEKDIDGRGYIEKKENLNKKKTTEQLAKEIDELAEEVDDDDKRYYTMTLKQLKDIAKDRKIKGYSNKKKNQLIQMLKLSRN